MAPEQRLDPRRAGPPSDVYGLGATAYFLTTGRRPLELAMSIVDPDVLLRVPEPLRAWVDQATATGPEDRWPSASAMADAIAQAAESLPPEALATDGAIAAWASVTAPSATTPG
jgi:serine/threonine-protein kinase